MPLAGDTDLSPAAQRAGRAAASLAQQLGDELHLVHVADELGSEFMVGHEEEDAPRSATRSSRMLPTLAVAIVVLMHPLI